MDLENRIALAVELGEYMLSEEPEWMAAKNSAFLHNPWFTPAFLDKSIQEVADRFLQKPLLEDWLNAYQFPSVNSNPKEIGLVMAGNIPLVGFHDFLCCFLSGHRQSIKMSSRDAHLFPEIIRFMTRKDASISNSIRLAPILKGMDAYIATGSNNSARYFDYYFAKYPSLIRRNRTSIALLEGNETDDELSKLADDVFLYFGLGCRNVTQVFVPEHYDFVPLLQAFRKYSWMADHHKYKNNYDYRLSLAILNKMYYMTNDNVLMLENTSPYSPISVLHYQFYKELSDIETHWNRDELQCVVGRRYTPFGSSQEPGLVDYADGVDTMKFLRSL